jgi:hypothetical protein
MINASKKLKIISSGFQMKIKLFLCKINFRKNFTFRCQNIYNLRVGTNREKVYGLQAKSQKISEVV